MTVRVIRYTALPAMPPAQLTVLMWLLLDRLQPSGWVWGVVIALLALAWLSFLVRFCWHEELGTPVYAEETPKWYGKGKS